MNEIQKTAAELSNQSDRYLFICLLIVIGIAVVWVARYFVKNYEQLIADHKVSREAHLHALQNHQQALENIVGDQNATAKTLAVVIDRNTTALEQNTDEIRRCREQRDRHGLEHH